MSKLFTPIRLGSVELANRIMVSPMCQYSATEGVANDWHLAHYGMLAASGAGLLVLEATAVEQRGRISPGCLAIDSEECVEGLKRVVAHCRRFGTARLGIQLAHAGRKASAQRPWEGGRALGPDAGPWETVAPSALPFAEGWHTPRELGIDDIEALEEAFVTGSARAAEIGFEVIELHMAHGYLFHQFLSPISNRRQDEYGGSLENRTRFPLEVARRIVEALPEGVELGVRLSGTDWIEGGFTIEEAVEVARRLKELGVSYVTVSSGGIALGAKIPLGPGYQVELAERVRKETGVTTCSVGLIVDPNLAEEIVSNGRADMVALARGFLDNPHWAWLAADRLGASVPRPPQYARSGPELWPGAAMR